MSVAAGDDAFFWELLIGALTRCYQQSATARRQHAISAVPEILDAKATRRAGSMTETVVWQRFIRYRPARIRTKIPAVSSRGAQAMHGTFFLWALIIVWVCLSGSPVALAGDENPDPIVGQRMAQPCLSCHQLANFARFNPDELLIAITAITAGERGHIPLPLTLTKQDIANIAAFISESNAPAE